MKVSNIEVCEEKELHQDRIEEVKDIMPDSEQLKEMAEMYKLFSDFSRVKMLYLLSKKELCVCDLTDLMDINQSAVSNQLRVLRNSKLISYRKEGKNTYYHLTDDCVREILHVGLRHTRDHTHGDE